MSLETQRLRFGEFCLDRLEKTLHHRGEVVALTPKAFELLVALIEDHGRVIEKNDLMDRVWAGSFVEEGNLAYTIRLLRKALGDDPRRPQFIETIPRRGYRFIGVVTPAPEEGDNIPARSEIATQESEPRPARLAANDNSEAPSGPWRIAFPALGISVAVLLTVGLWYSNGNAFNSEVPVLSSAFASEKLSTNGEVFNAAISPDGQTVVYVNGFGRESQSVWIRQLDSGNNVEIIPESGDRYGGLAFSPDGNFIFFTRKPFGQGPQFDVYRVSIFGGVPQKIAAETQGWINVSPKGDHISFVRCYYLPDENCSLWVADSADGANERMLTSRPAPFRIADNDFSPDGRRVAFAAGQSENAANDFELMEIDIETGVERSLTQERFFNIKSLTWLPKGGLLITASRIPNKNFRIWQITRPSGDAVPLTKDAETYAALSLDTAGTRLISTWVRPDFKLHLVDLGAMNQPASVTDALSASFGPDGSIIFSSVTSGNEEVWSVRPDRSRRRQLTNDLADDVTPIASKSGETIYFGSNRTGRLEIWRMNADGSDQRQVTRDGGGFPVSADDTWVYFHDGLNRSLRRVATDGSRDEVIWAKPAYRFVLSSDSKFAAFTERIGDERILRVISSGKGALLHSFAPSVKDMPITELAFAPDGSALFYFVGDTDRQVYSLWRQPLPEGPAKKVGEITGESGEIFEGPNFSISPDGKKIIFVRGRWRHDAVLLKGLQ